MSRTRSADPGLVPAAAGGVNGVPRPQRNGQVVNAIHPYIGINSGTALNHQPEFAAHCVGGDAERALLDAATALAWTALDVAGSAGTAGFSVTLAGSPASVTGTVTRLHAGEAVHVPLVALDQCGAWPTFVGGGPNAF